MNPLLPSLFALILASALTVRGAQSNFLVIVTDDQRPDSIHALGNTYIETPNLDQLVREGATFSRAIAANPLCVPSRAEILTGASSFRQKPGSLGTVINPKLVLWASTMREAGYHTWYSGKWMNDGSPKTRGYEETRALFSSGGGRGVEATYPKGHNGRPVTGYRGWTFKTNDGKAEPEKGVGLTPATDCHIADGAIEFIERRTEKPFFLHVNFTAPHDPLHIPKGYENKYDPRSMPVPANYLVEHPFDHGNAGRRDESLLPVPRDLQEVKAEIAAYYAVISHMDEQVGRILNALRRAGLDQKTVIIFTSDHGLALGSHGLMGKQNMYEHSIGVPLIMRGPGIPQNKSFRAQTYLRDLYPTVCDMAAIPIPETVEGRSLVPVLAGLNQEIYPEVYGYYHADGYNGELPIQRMVRTERWKLIFYSHLNRYQLFDLAHDPHELKDLSAVPAFASVLANLKRRMDDWFAPRIQAFSASRTDKGP